MLRFLLLTLLGLLATSDALGQPYHVAFVRGSVLLGSDLHPISIGDRFEETDTLTFASSDALLVAFHQVHGRVVLRQSTRSDEQTQTEFRSSRANVEELVAELGPSESKPIPLSSRSDGILRTMDQVVSHFGSQPLIVLGRMDVQIDSPQFPLDKGQFSIRRSGDSGQLIWELEATDDTSVRIAPQILPGWEDGRALKLPQSQLAFTNATGTYTLTQTTIIAVPDALLRRMARALLAAPSAPDPAGTVLAFRLLIRDAYGTAPHSLDARNWLERNGFLPID